MKTEIGVFTVTKSGNTVTIQPGMLIFKGVRNASTSVTVLSEEDANYRYKQFIEYAEMHTMINQNLN